MPASEPPLPSSWEAVVAVREDRALEEELAARLRRGGDERAIGVTDLISLRRAFYRTVCPAVPIPAARQARLDQGRALHRILGARLAREGTLEARVRRDGIVGRIDLLAELPTEVKTATGLVEPNELPADRPDHIEQLGMYCALVDRPIGRLLTLVAGPKGVSDVQVVDVSFRSAAEILSEMRRRAELLRTAWAEGRVDPLPRCPWYGRGCEFEDASVCTCTGEEEPVLRPISQEVSSTSERADIRERVRPVLSEPILSEDTTSVRRFRDLLYPRRAYFERTAPPATTTTPPPREATAPVPRPDLYARLTAALESGPAGEVSRLPAGSAEPEEEVVGFRGRPLMVRTSRAWARFREDELVARAPQYALELGLRCATTGTDSGVIVIGFERADVDRDRVQVLELRFSSRTPFSRLYRERSRELAVAIRDRVPGTLRACPGWMVADCPYRSECGCGASDSRVTR